ncbi:MAG TPA: radical SAM protein [Candidatus Lokiarchaeia archaeon]|nr:radical SAM protein [Candidatus Lokiarchaeia archaeon]
MTIASLDLLLVNPATELAERGTWNREPPLGLLYIAAVLERVGFSCQIIELSIDDRPIEDILEAIPVPRVIGFTCLTNTARKTFEIAARARSWYGSQAIDVPLFVMGGPHATFAYEDILETRVIDFCFIGEAEGFITEFIELVSRVHAIEDIKDKLLTRGEIKVSLAFLDNDGLPRSSTTDDVIPDDLDTIPFPARHLYPINQPDHVYNTATVIVNRGCPNQCIFCSRQALFKKCRWRSPANVLAEIKAIHDAGTYEYYNIYDNLTVNRDFMKKLLRLMIYDGSLALPWGAELRADMIDEESAELLAVANCKCVATGIESANENILKIAGKFQSIEKVKKGLDLLKEREIPVQAYFVIGLPGETQETFKETIAFIDGGPLEPKVDKVDFFGATPYPGSALYTRRVELGIEIVDPDFDHYDCQHLICKIPSISMPDLESIWGEAKRYESRFN